MLHSSDIYFGLSARAARELAFQYAKELQIKMPESWMKYNRAGRHWLERFMAAHPALSLRKPEATSLARAAAFNPVNVANFFDLYEQVTQSIEFTPNNIYNVDETGLTTVHKPDRVISRRGRKQVGRITAAERGTVVSMALAICANGSKVPPLLVFPRVRYQPHLIKDGPAGCVGAATPSGYMNGAIFLEFIKHFHNFTRCSPEKPVLLLLDNHESHRTLDVIRYCRANGIHMLSFPPHCSHRMQPLDVSVFGPFKKAANELCADWVKQHPGRVTQITDLPEIMDKALLKGATEKNIIAGFKACGLWPYNRHIFDEIDFAPSETTDRLYSDEELIMDDDIPMVEDLELPMEFEDGAVFEEISIDLQDFDFETSEAPLTSAPQPTNTLTPETSTPESVQTTQEHSTLDQSSQINFGDILQAIAPFPQAPPRTKARRGRQPGKSTILTSDTSFEDIENRYDERNAKIAAAAARKEAAAKKKAAAAEKKAAIAAKKAAAAEKKALAAAEKNAAALAKRLAAAAKKKKPVKRLTNQRSVAKTSINYAEMSDLE